MKKPMSKMDIQAKMDVLKELYDMCSAKLGEKVQGGLDELKGMKQVTVAAPDEESLKEGLEMAEELTETPEMEEKPEMPEMESEEDDESGGSMLDAIRRKRAMSRDY